MTTIFYDGKNLHADKRVLKNCFPSRASDDGVKLFINPENTVAVGLSGNLPNSEKEKMLLFKLSKMIFDIYYTGLLKDKLELDKINKKIDKEKYPYVLGITNNKAFALIDGDVYPQTGFMACVGTGRFSMIGCYYVVKDVATAFKLSSEIDNLSSSEYMSVMADSLNPYVME